MYQVFSPSRVKKRRDERHPDDEGVGQDRDREQQAELLRDAVGAEDERREDGAHDQRGGDDDPADRRDAMLDRLAGLEPVHVLLADAAHQEDHVVHREAEQDRECDRRDERLDRARLVEAGEPQQVSLLDHQGQHAEPDERREERRHRGGRETTIERNAIASTRNVTPMM